MFWVMLPAGCAAPSRAGNSLYFPLEGRSSIIDAVRNGPNWKDSVIFLTYDEHGGFYDHVPPPPAPQGGALNPDGISPGQCADASAQPDSEAPGGGEQ